LQLGRFRKRPYRFIALVQKSIAVGEQLMREGNLWVKLQRLLKDLDSFISAFQLCVDVSDRNKNDGVFWPYKQRRFVGSDCFIPTLKRGVAGARVEVSAEVIWLELQHHRILAQRFVILPFLL